MSCTVYDEKCFSKRVPKAIRERTKENMEVYFLSLADAFEEAVRTLSPKGSRLWRAWYHNDFREYIPCAYESQYLNFKAYPLKYK